MSLFHSIRSFTLHVCILLMLICAFTTSSAQAATSPVLLSKLAELQTLLLQYQALLLRAPQVLGATTIVVTTNTELLAALGVVKGGETIQLAPGNYGAIFIAGGIYSQMSVAGVRSSFKSPVLTIPVKITSQDPNNRAVIDHIFTRSTDNWIFDSLIIKPAVPGVLGTLAVTIGGNNNTMQNCYVTYSYENSDSWDVARWLTSVGSGIGVFGGSNNIIQNNYVSNIYMGIVVNNDAPNTKVLQNVVNYFSGDGIRGLGAYSLFEGNIVKNIRIIDGNHPDGFQSWSVGLDGKSGTGVVSGITVRGNVFLISENLNHPLAIDMQGISLFDGDYKDWVIQDNVVMTDSYHGIAVYGGINVIVDHNTVLNIRNNLSHRTWITLSPHKGATSSAINTISNNISSTLLLTPGGTLFNATNTIALQLAAGFPSNNFVVPIADYTNAYVDLNNFNARLQSASTYGGAGSRIFIDPRMTTAPIIPGTPPPVVPPVPTLTFSSSVALAVTGGTVTLNWTSTDATICTASGDWTGTKTISGSAVTSALTLGTKIFTLICAGTSGSITKTVNVIVTAVVPPPPVPSLTLTSSLSSVVTGGTAILTWSSANATACVASGDWTGTKSVFGSIVTNALTVGIKTFTLVCAGTNSGGSVTKTINVIVTATPTPTPTPTSGSGSGSYSGSNSTPALALTLTVDSPVSSFAQTMLTWNSENATTCSAGGDWTGTKATSGSEPTDNSSPTGIKTYILSCTGAGGTIAKNVSVTATKDSTADTPPQTVAPFTIGDRIAVIDIANIRTTGLVAPLTLLGTHLAGSQGVLIAGPTISTDSYGIITWFNVKFDTGISGWMAANNFKLVTATPTLNPNQAKIDQLYKLLTLLQQMLALLLAKPH